MSGIGNLGIGNSSIATFGDKDSLPANQSDPYFMGVDVSQQPLDPIRELNLNALSPETAKNAKNESVVEAATNDTIANITAPDETTSPGQTPENLTYSAYACWGFKYRYIYSNTCLKYGRLQAVFRPRVDNWQATIY